MKKTNRLIFVYNANAGLFNSLADAAHKVLSPSTYKCSLCMLTYGNVSMKREWREYIKSLPFEVVFLHKDEFEKVYPSQKAGFPVAFRETSAGLTKLAEAKEINACKSLTELKELVDKKLKNE